MSKQCFWAILVFVYERYTQPPPTNQPKWQNKIFFVQIFDSTFKYTQHLCVSSFLKNVWKCWKIFCSAQIKRIKIILYANRKQITCSNSQSTEDITTYLNAATFFDLYLLEVIVFLYKLNYKWKCDFFPHQWKENNRYLVCIKNRLQLSRMTNPNQIWNGLSQAWSCLLYLIKAKMYRYYNSMV